MHWILRTTATARSTLRGRGSRPADGPAGRASSGHESLERVDDVVHASIVDPRVDTHEERVVHHDVGIRQVADHPALNGLEGRVAEQVAAEQAARLDPIG